MRSLKDVPNYICVPSNGPRSRRSSSVNVAKYDQQEMLTRAALGRPGIIGELYDARTESLSSRSLFKSSLPEIAIQRQDLGRMEFDYKFMESVMDCLNLLKVEGELQLGILCGLVKVDGSGNFLCDERKSEKIVSCTLIFKLQTVCEKFYAAWNEVLHHIDLQALEDARNTHVIVESSWGANCLLSLESHCGSENELKEKKGMLGAEVEKLGKLFSCKGEGKLESVKEGFSKINNIRIKVLADVAPKNQYPTSIEDFFKFMQDVPSMVEKLNNGKGKPLNYVLLPLSTIRKLAKIETTIENVVVHINESFVLSTVYFLDQIAAIKRKLNDHIEEMNVRKKYVQKEDYDKSKIQLHELLGKESSLKELIADIWKSVRCGETALTGFVKKLEEAKHKFNIYQYEFFLDSREKINRKLSRVKICESKGITYLGIGDTFDDLLAENPSAEFIVFITSGEAENTELNQNMYYYFITLAEYSPKDTKFVIVDLDHETTFWNNKIKAPGCVSIKGGRILSQTLYQDYVSELTKNFALPKEGFHMNVILQKPMKRVPLKIVCPNFQKSICGSERVEWNCARCKEVIEYGFDKKFYCTCGSCECDAYVFRCSDAKHGRDFVEPEGKFLENMLSKLNPCDDMNILILGQSGVGKTTWINSIVNYLNYRTLEEAERRGVICTIPSKFSVYGREISVGEESVNEETKMGDSSTQCCHTYSFFWGDRCVRLIDTPGLGDVRGIEQDKKNIHKVIGHLKYLKHLHGVCILLKAGENRMHALFTYCIKELLVNFHRSVTKNMVFCFTNARNTFYTPGAVATILSKLFGEMGIEDSLTLNKNNSFSLDNEAFLFLCSATHPEIHHPEHLQASFQESWKISLLETERLFNTIKSFEPHDLQNTVTLFNARNRILCLTPALAEICKTIHINLTAKEKHQAELENSKKSMEQLEKILMINTIQLEAEPLPYPMTVCTSQSCVSYISHKSVNITEIEYKTHCHPHCFIKGVKVNTLGNVLLKECSAMSDGVCRNCKCSWANHIHITFLQKRVEIQFENPEVAKNIRDEKSEQELKEKVLESIKALIEDYKEEEEFIIQAAVKFGMFLKENAISAYNDAAADYLEYLIKGEENKQYKTKEEKELLKKLKETLARYEEEIKIFDDVLSKADKPETIQISDVLSLEEKLYNLKISGKSIKKTVEAHKKGMEQMLEYQETPIHLGKRQNFSKGDMNKPGIFDAGKQLIRKILTFGRS